MISEIEQIEHCKSYKKGIKDAINIINETIDGFRKADCSTEAKIYYASALAQVECKLKALIAERTEK